MRRENGRIVTPNHLICSFDEGAAAPGAPTWSSPWATAGPTGGFGVRVEDTVLVTAEGNSVPKIVRAQPYLFGRNIRLNSASIRLEGGAGIAGESQVTLLG